VKFKEEILKLSSQKPGLPGNVISSTLCPLTPHNAGLAGRVPAHEFHLISKKPIDQIKLLAEGHNKLLRLATEFFRFPS
jgi:hypothetical protein